MIDKIKQTIDLLCNDSSDCRVQRIHSDVILASREYDKVNMKMGPIEVSAPCGGFTFKLNDNCYAWRTLAYSANGSISTDDYSVIMDNGFMVIYVGDGKYVISDVRDNEWFDVYAQITPCPNYIDVFAIPLSYLVYFKGKIDIRMKERDAELAVKQDVAWAKINGVRISVFRGLWPATAKSVRDLAELARKTSQSL
jgi:hypothetical protein